MGCTHPIPSPGPNTANIEAGQAYMFSYICPKCEKECVGQGFKPPDVVMRDFYVPIAKPKKPIVIRKVK